MPTPAQNYVSAINAYNSAARGDAFSAKKPADDYKDILRMPI
jgi:hypothetical protein